VDVALVDLLVYNNTIHLILKFPLDRNRHPPW